METPIIHKAATRGFADHGWLKAKHSFSFAGYFNPERIHFGVLRVLNDDYIEGGMGFGTHPHDNMEIITIPLEGAIEHRDSMGNHSVIQAGEIQVMSAGTGIQHSEFNHYKDKPLKLFQIWLFPNKHNVQPRYDQLKLDLNKSKNNLMQVLSPNPDDEGVWIHQDAWFYISSIDENVELSYVPKRSLNGIYLMVINGKVNVNGNRLEDRDAIGIAMNEAISIKSLSPDTKILLMDLPMDLN